MTDVTGLAAWKGVVQAGQNAVNEQRELLQRYEERIKEHCYVVSDATAKYIQTGVAYANLDMQLAVEKLKLGTAREYFASVAKELKRPLIYAEKTSQGQILLKLPRNTATENLAAGLLLVAEEWPDSIKRGATGRWSLHRLLDFGPVIKLDTPRGWQFYFQKKDGEQQYKLFVEMCRTNPVARVVLRLGPLPVE